MPERSAASAGSIKGVFAGKNVSSPLSCPASSAAKPPPMASVPASVVVEAVEAGSVASGVMESSMAFSLARLSAAACYLSKKCADLLLEKALVAVWTFSCRPWAWKISGW